MFRVVGISGFRVSGLGGALGFGFGLQGFGLRV